MRTRLGLATCLICIVSLAQEDTDWYPSKYGADDTLVAINNLSEQGTVNAAKLVKTGKVYPLGVLTGWETPAYPPRTFSITILDGPGTGATQGENKTSGNDDLLVTWMGIGSQIDGLGHIGIDHVYYNGLKAEDFVGMTGLTELSVDRLPPIVTRGVLLDMTAHFGVDMLTEGTVFNSAEIQAQAAAQEVTIGNGDVVLFYTGWINLTGVDNERLMSGEPGLGVDGAAWLAKQGVVAVGSDTWGLEVIPHENVELAFPVHQELLTKNGVYILENMDTRELAKDEGWEFMFVLGQPRFEGSVQAVINPIAIR
ncbi:MAG: cyclase family protein [Gammaproteobacteria bacterium]|nr:cyclase family protein [Gammaproteobacteria bacterium]